MVRGSPLRSAEGSGVADALSASYPFLQCLNNFPFTPCSAIIGTNKALPLVSKGLDSQGYSGKNWYTYWYSRRE